MVNPMLVAAIVALIGSPVAVDEVDTTPDQTILNQVEGVGEDMKRAAGLLNETQVLNENLEEAQLMLDRNHSQGLQRAQNRIQENIQRIQRNANNTPEGLENAQRVLQRTQERIRELKQETQGDEQQNRFQELIDKAGEKIPADVSPGGGPLQ